MLRVSLTFILSLCILAVCVPSYAFTNSAGVIISGGYGTYDDVYKNDGSTGIIRIAATDQVAISTRLQLGAELGIQTGNRMRLTAATVAPLVYVTLPIFITVHPPIDFLLRAQVNIIPSFYLLGKVGVSYLSLISDSQTILTYSFIKPELQIGAGYQLSNRAQVEVVYQQIMGSRMELDNINIMNGTATLDATPTLQALFFSATVNIL